MVKLWKVVQMAQSGQTAAGQGAEPDRAGRQVGAAAAQRRQRPPPQVVRCPSHYASRYQRHCVRVIIRVAFRVIIRVAVRVIIRVAVSVTMSGS